MIQTATKLEKYCETTALRSSAEKPGVIEASAVYTLREFAARMGMTQSAMRGARQRGLKIRRIGKRAFILGKDAIEFIEAAGK